jgi:hypothetical protein
MCGKNRKLGTGMNQNFFKENRGFRPAEKGYSISADEYHDLYWITDFCSQPTNSVYAYSFFDMLFVLEEMILE